MITRTSRAPKRIAATAAAVAMVGSALALSGTTALADHVPATTYGGSDRYETATLVADALPSVAEITVANGLNFPDGLAGAFLEDAILLTEADSLHPTTKAWLDANNAEITDIQIVGGEAVVSAAVATELATYGTVTRLSGPTRYDTAVDIAEAQSPDATEIIVADGLDFPDALASGPLAIEADAPIILNDGATLRPEVTAYLAANTQITDAYIVGGNAAVPTTVEVELTALGITVERLSGPTRDETAVEIANELQALTGGYDTGAIIANRLRFADAMVAGPLGAAEDYPILLVAEDALTVATEDYLVANCATIGTIVAVGGEGVINATTSEAARQAATCEVVSNQTFTVTPSEAAVNTVSTTAAPNQGARTYTVATGEATSVDIALVDADLVTVDSDGVVTFVNAGTTTARFADQGTVAAEIEVVGGVATSGNYVDNVTPSNGSVTFVVDSESFDEVIPVVFADTTAPTANQLNLNADNEPTEAFGIGGQKTWLPAEATTGANADDGDVVFVDKDNNSFVVFDDLNDADATNDVFRLYNYADGDTFTYDDGANVATLAQFELALSEGDVLDVAYSTTFVSTFDIVTDVPGTPTGVTAVAGDFDADAADATSDDVRVTWSAPNPPNGLIAGYLVNLYDDAPTTAGCQTGSPIDLNGGAAGTALSTTQTTADLEELANDTYCVTVQAVSAEGTVGTASAPAFIEVNVIGADTQAPTLTSVIINDGQAATVPGNGAISSGDTIALNLNEAVVLADNTSVSFIDGDGTIGTLVRGVNATMSTNAAGTVLFIQVTGAPLLEAAGGDAVLNTDAVVIEAAGIEDAATNDLRISVTDNSALAADDTVGGFILGTYDSVTVSGCGLTDATVTPDATSGAFTVTTASAADCVLTFTIVSGTTSVTAVMAVDAV